MSESALNSPKTLIGQLRNHDWAQLKKTVNALVDIGTPAVEPLVEALSDEDGYVRAGAAEALGRIRDQRAFEPLLEALRYEGVGRTPDGEHTEARGLRAALALGQLGNRGSVGPLLEVLSESLANDLTLSWYVIEALGVLGDRLVLAHLEPLQNHEDVDVRKSAAIAISKINERVPQDDA